jgi:hypothetical protein
MDPMDEAFVSRSIEQSELRVRDGDDPRWALRTWDDSDWEATLDRDTITRDRGIFWVRLRVRSRDERDPLPAGLSVALVAAWELYWDGTLLYRSGVPGSSRASEVPGPLYSRFEVPSGLLGPGEHVIALRLSTYHFNRPDRAFGLAVLNVDLRRYEAIRERWRLFPSMGMGATLTMGLAAFVMWLVAARQVTLLLFAALCLSAAATVGLALARGTIAMPYSWSYPVWCVQTAFAGVCATCLVQLVAVELSLPRRRWILSALLAGFAAVTVMSKSGFSVDVTSQWWRIAFGFSLAGGLWAAWRRRPGARLVVAGVIATALLHEHDRQGFLWGAFLPAMLPAIVSLLVAVALRLRAERQDAQQAKLTAARLEIELLKKSLQPHFLLNTLTTLAQTIEENPAQAVALINDLATEFRALARLAGEQSVLLAQELELCRAHLRVMSVRTERAWKLDCAGADLDARVPPALFLTLIENSFSHQQPIDGATTFTLRALPPTSESDGPRYVFVAPGKVHHDHARAESGTGLRYVKARLEEGWPGAWEFAQREVAQGWETTIAWRAIHAREVRA